MLRGNLSGFRHQKKKEEKKKKKKITRRHVKAKVTRNVDSRLRYSKRRFEAVSFIIFLILFPFLSYSDYKMNSDFIFAHNICATLHVNLIISM